MAVHGDKGVSWRRRLSQVNKAINQFDKNVTEGASKSKGYGGRLVGWIEVRPLLDGVRRDTW